MKKILTLFIVSALINGCKKEDKEDGTSTAECTACNTSPEADQANDAKSGGVYKGI
jgi:hypothetical protein